MASSRKQHYFCALTADKGKSSIANSINDTIIDREETYGYNERKQLTERKALSGLELFHMEDSSTGIFHTYHQDEQGSTAYITGSDGVAENCYIYDVSNIQIEDICYKH